MEPAQTSQSARIPRHYCDLAISGRAEPRSPSIKLSTPTTAVVEARTYTVIHDVDWLQDNHEWPGLKSVVMVESEREIPETAKDHAKIEHETRFYITSLVWLACQIAPAIRGHWMIENGLHWVMDMMFRDDECRVRTDNAPASFTTIKHMALNLIRLKSSGKKDSMKTRRFVASWDDDYLASLVGG